MSTFSSVTYKGNAIPNANRFFSRKKDNNNNEQ